VSDPSPLLDRAGIEEAFRRLGARLAKRGVVADLYVFGGAAMALAYDSRRATRDDVLASVREIFPEQEPPARLRLLLKDIFSGQDR
jgi:hypothetical protein